jgi:hypothetical protein
MQTKGGYVMRSGAAVIPTSLEQVPASAEAALVPHRYPISVFLAGLCVVASAAVAIKQLPPYYHAASLLQRAEALASHGQDKEAIQIFTDALQVTPDSRRIRIRMSISYFRSPDEADHEKATDVIGGMTFDKYEWADLSPAIPAAYQSRFTTGKK